MRLTVHIIPRRMILWGLALLALGLRLWGLDWGPGQAGVLHPGEWTWQVIDHLSFSRPTYPGIWTQAFFSLAALVQGLLSWVAGWVEVLLGRVHQVGEVVVSARLAGRFTVALLGSGQVLLAYAVGRRFFDSVATGLLAAAVVAVSPLLVAHGHYLSRDVPLGVAVMACLWAVWLMASEPRAVVMAWAGLCLGLTVTTRASGSLVFLLMAAAYYLGVRRSRPARSRKFLLWPSAWLVGLLAGLVVGYPGFVLQSDRTAELLTTSFSPPAPGTSWGGFVAGRALGALSVAVQTVGPELLVLWGLGVWLILRARRWDRLLPALVPPLFFLAGITVLRGSLEGLAAIWLPALALVACWPLVWLCRRLPGYGRQVAAVSLLGLLLCGWPLWRALGVDYLFWQQDTFSSARFWVEANLPRQALILAGPRTPLNVFQTTRPWDQKKGLAALRKTGGYLVVSSLGQEDRADPWQDWVPPGGLSLERLRGRLLLLKRFDLKSAWRSAVGSPATFPRWVSPRVDVLAARDPLQVVEPLALYRPPVGAGRRYAVVYGGQGAYSRYEGAMLVEGGRRSRRVLVLPREVERLGLALLNQGEELALVEVSQGPWPARRVTLYPGQEVDLTLPARSWPPMMRAVYPVEVYLRRGGSLLARLYWDPLVMARRALEGGRFAEVVEVLSPLARKGGAGFEARAMLAEALVRLGRPQEAARVLKGRREAGEEAGSFPALARAGEEDAAWDRRFQALTGYYPDLLRQASSLSYVVEGPPCRGDGRERPLRGAGFHGVFQRRQGEPGGQLRLWLEEPYPATQLRVRLHLAVARGPAPARERLAVCEVWGHGFGGGRLLARREILGRDLPRGRGVVSLPVSDSRAGARLEVRLAYRSARTLDLERLVVGVDLIAHLRHLLRWYYDAQGRLALTDKRYPQAEEAFRRLLAIDPAFREAYLPSARALIDMGKLKQALARVRGAEVLFASQPAHLGQVRDLYRVLQRPKDVERVEERLAYLRPSLKREARFACGLTLLGYDLSANRVERGGSLEVTYYWQCWQTPPLNYFVFVHLRGPDRTLNFDHLLDHGRRQMTDLEVGEVVREEYRLAIPKDATPGRWRLVVGLWDPQHTGRGVPILQGAGAGSEEVELAVIQIR